ncbi:MAG: ThiF family adenylyltransferase [Cytophagales bacterium]|nr:ThiF family adenylyltransferase [Cytophagales bacterium]
MLDIDTVVKDKSIFEKKINIGKAYLAGAGAIGNSFLYALSTFHVEGELKVVDPDFVSAGNLNRCLLFEDGDIEKNKTDVLVQKMQPYLKDLKLIPLTQTLAKIPDNVGGAWLDKLIVGVDSRRARRNLQGEIPREVFDSSTTGISEIVIHHHKRPLKGACLGCVYVKEKQEEAHETHIAEALGVSLNKVKQQFIDEEAAELIALKYQINKCDILGVPYDTLFKQLCGEGKLMTAQNNQVLAPLAFVSALAGAFLALMLVEKHLKISDYNYWRLTPWANLNLRLQQNKEPIPAVNSVTTRLLCE